MAFTQEKKLNIAKCDGCEKRCEITTNNMFPMASDPAYYQFQILVDGEPIRNFLDRNGIEHHLAHYPNTHEESMKLARKILPSCDYYKTR